MSQIIDKLDNLYVTDGACHNAEPGTYGHECGKRARFIAKSSGGFWGGFCADCRTNGWEAKYCTEWRDHPSWAFDA